MIVDEGVIVEIVRPGTGDPVPEGDVGEVVVTTFNRAYPLIRFGTGDMSAVLAGPSPCGRTNMRIKGWMGRADQRTKVRGMFVDPEQIAEIAKKHPGLGRLRLVIDWVNQADVMTLQGRGGAALARSRDGAGGHDPHRLQGRRQGRVRRRRQPAQRRQGDRRYPQVHMILRDATEADLAAVRRLLDQLGYAPDEAEFRRRFDSVRATAGHRIIVAEEGGVCRRAARLRAAGARQGLRGGGAGAGGRR